LDLSFDRLLMMMKNVGSRLQQNVEAFNHYTA